MKEWVSQIPILILNSVRELSESIRLKISPLDVYKSVLWLSQCILGLQESNWEVVFVLGRIRVIFCSSKDARKWSLGAMYVIWNFGRELGVKASRFKLMDISFHLIEFWCSIWLLCCSLLTRFLQDQIMANFSQPFMFSTMPEYAFFKKDMKILVKVEWQLSDSFKGRQYCWRNSNISTCNFLPGTYKGDYKSALCYTDASAPEGTERGHRW